MSRLTLRLPETLHKQLIHLAEGEGVSLNQYIVYTLTRQVAMAYAVRTVPEEEVNQQKQAFNALLQTLGEVSSSEIEVVLAEREMVQPEEELNPEIVNRLEQRIRNAAKA
ncbi:MAG: toxin-antitoxin system HicB family antitoxin [Xenococcaceae cyanobacterium]